MKQVRASFEVFKIGHWKSNVSFCYRLVCLTSSSSSTLFCSSCLESSAMFDVRHQSGAFTLLTLGFLNIYKFLNLVKCCAQITDIENLVVAPISKASVRQRARRTGRIRPGKCYR
uniref:Uncharacterized protein n=1 Tax=Helianthus annuus TaxID=4232 RepID=A0A251TXJ1_HELAN